MSIEVKTVGMIIVVFVIMMAVLYTQLETTQLAILGLGLAAGLAIVMFVLDIWVYRPINGLIRRSRRRLGGHYEQEDPHDRDEIRELEFLINTIIATFTEVQTSTQATTNRSESDLLRLQAYNRQLVDVNDIGREISRALPYRETVERILARAKTFLKADLVTLISLRQGSPTYEIEGAIGVQAPDMSADCCLLTSDCPVRRGMTEGNLVRSADHTCTLFPETMKSQLIIPLRVENVGNLALLATATNSESFDEIPGQILTTLQDHMHSALTNARKYDHMRRQVITDHLTRLYNRRYFMEQAEEVLRKSLQGQTADVGRHDRHRPLQALQRRLRPRDRRQGAADRLQRHAAARARDRHLFALRRRGVRDAAAGRARRACRLHGEPAAKDAGRDPLHRASVSPATSRSRISMGVATCPRDATEINQLLDLADQALYKAKASGRNQVVLYGVEAQPLFYDD